MSVEHVIYDINKFQEDFQDWIVIRFETIVQLRRIAEYIDKVFVQTEKAKMVGSGGGIAAGILSVVGGALTIASSGAATPVLVTGIVSGLASGATTGASAIAQKVICSEQYKEAKKALEKDVWATSTLRDRIASLQTKRTVVMQLMNVASGTTGYSVANSSIDLARFAAGAGGPTFQKMVGDAGMFQKMASTLGEDGLAKLAAIASTKTFAGCMAILAGGIGIAFDVYQLSKGIMALAKVGASDKIREEADKLEKEMRRLTSRKSWATQYKGYKDIPLAGRGYWQPGYNEHEIKHLSDSSLDDDWSEIVALPTPEVDCPRLAHTEQTRGLTTWYQ